MLKFFLVAALLAGTYRSYLAFRLYKKDQANAGVKTKNLVIKALTFGFTSFESFKPAK